MQSWDLSDSVKRLLEFRNARDWEQFHRPKELAAALTIEAGELQELFLWRDSETADQILQDAPERFTNIEEEVADLAMYLLLFAHELRIDIGAAVMKKLAKNERRFPVKEYRGIPNKARLSEDS